MNTKTLNKLRSIFAKEINKDVSELNSSDIKLFEDWITYGLATKYIKDIEIDNINENLYIQQKVKRDEPAKCRNCKNIVINLVERKAFGNVTLQLAIYCSYWLYKNNNDYKNALYNISLDDPSCTQFLSHKNLLDTYNIDIDGIDYIPITQEDLVTLPLTSFIDKGFNIKKINGEFFLYKHSNEDEIQMGE